MFSRNRKYGILPIAINAGVTAAAFIACWLLISYAGTPVVPTVLSACAACIAIQAVTALIYLSFVKSTRQITE